MSKNLVIVESPAKAKTIEKFLGSDYHVLSSQGHIRDIEPLGKNSMGIDFDHNYAPNYVIDPKKQTLLETLRSESSKADTVWLASDEDREGEAIAWHLKEVLNLDSKHTKRIVFHEITKSAILQAIQEPRDIDYNLVNAQQARRVLDRIVGFELSPILWKKVTTGLSAGRVQSVAVRLIVEREREIENFTSTSHYRITADFTGANPGDASVLHTVLNHTFAHKKEAIAFLEQCKSAQFYIEDIQRKPQHRMPAPPFTTSSLQQEAARKLHFAVSKTMRLAQSLYESGSITYMRTDSVNLSSLAINTAKQEILSEYGEQYSRPRQFTTSAKGAQEAHEAIRPTYMDRHKAGNTADEQKLYELIWKRTLASQMADAEIETTRMEVSVSNSEYRFVATGEVVNFDGFMRLYVQSTDESEEGPRVLPHMALHERLRRQTVTATQTYTKPPFRFTEATLVKKMEELGIGRPSTYATIIETIQHVKYVERGSVAGKKRDYNVFILKNDKLQEYTRQEIAGADSQKLLPTDLGRITNDFLVAQFPNILSYDFTAHSEEQFDLIAEGKADWVKTVDTFYKTFKPSLASIPAGKVAARLLGTDPVSGQPVYAKISKLGPCVQLGDSDNEKPKFASLKKGQSIFTITLREALELFKNAMPYTLCEWAGEPIIIGEGKYGAYVHYKEVYITIPKSIDPMEITPLQAKDMITKKQEEQKPVRDWGDVQVLNGRYGMYIKTAEGNYRLPRNATDADLNEQYIRLVISTSEPVQKSAGKRSFTRKNAK
jgi:DNA topoisomerase-1